MLLITGCGGQLGTELKLLLPRAIGADVADLDITDAEAVRRFVRENKIDTIINCAAYTAVDKAEDEPEKCRLINVDGVRNLALTGAKMIHISTDYVFDGKGYKPYVETDQTGPISVYGQTKFEGEKAVLETAETCAVIRTAWLYSPYGTNFVKTMRRLGAEREKISVVADQIGTPTCAVDLAKAITVLLSQMKEGSKEVYHYSNEGTCSWYDFAREIMKLSGLNCYVEPIESVQYPTKAKRPFYSVLNKSKIKSLGIEVPHWQESLEKCLKKF